MIICAFLNCLPRLLYLYISIFEHDFISKMGTILYLIISSPVLKRFTIINHMDWDEETPKIVLPTVVNSKTSSIEHSTIDDVVPAETLASLLKQMPNICHLNCVFLSIFNEISHELETIHLPCLKQLSIDAASVKWDYFEALIKSIGHRVEIFKLRRNFSRDFLDANQWEQLIKTFLPHLSVFDMKCANIKSAEIGLIYTLINPFYSKFWIEREWFLNVTFNLYSMHCHIHSYK